VVNNLNAISSILSRFSGEARTMILAIHLQPRNQLGNLDNGEYTDILFNDAFVSVA
jgi:hypothetical protein